MSDGKTIQIKIAASGGDQAAAEVRKVETAAKELTTNTPATTGFGGMLDKIPEQATKATAKVQDLDQMVEDLAENLGKVSEETKQAGKEFEEAGDKTKKLDENVEKIQRMQKAQVIAQLGGQVSQLGAAFSSVADSIESFDAAGAKSLRSIGDNLETAGSAVSSMAIGFAVGGPLGAGVAALGEGIKYVVGEMGKAAEEAVKMESKYAGAFDKLIEKMGTVAAEKAKLELKNWLATLDDEEAAINRQNDALERNRGLIEAKAAAQAKLDAAKTKSEIAAVDADPNLSDAEKIRKKAEITEAAEKKKVEDAVNAQGRDVVAADQDAAAKDGEAQRLAADAEAIKKRKEAEDAERKELERKQKAKDAAAAAIPAAAAQAAADTKAAELGRRNPFGAGARQDKAEASQQALEDLKNKAYANPNKENQRLAELQANKGTLESEATKTAEAAKAAREAADKAKLDAAAKRRTLEETLPTTIETYNVERGGRATSSNAAASAAEARAKEKADREKEREAKKAAQDRTAGIKDDIAGREGKLDATARSRGLNMRNAGLANKNDTAAAVGKALSDGTDAAEIQKLGDQVREAAGKNGAAMTAALQKVLTELSGQAAEIEKLKGQIRKGRDLK